MLWSGDERPVIRNRQVRVAIQERGEVTPYGGLALAHDLAMRLGIDQDINASMHLLKIKLPYFESDHLLTHAYNSAFLMAGQLAWCLRAWLSLLALPKETSRWEWKWFRQAFVYVAARITQSGRRAKVYLAGCHRFVDHLIIASQRLQCFTFS